MFAFEGVIVYPAAAAAAAAAVVAAPVAILPPVATRRQIKNRRYRARRGERVVIQVAQAAVLPAEDPNVALQATDPQVQLIGETMDEAAIDLLEAHYDESNASDSSDASDSADK